MEILASKFFKISSHTDLEQRETEINWLNHPFKYDVNPD